MMPAAIPIEIADIDATIAAWRRLGVRSREIAEQIECWPRWHEVRQRMIALTVPPERVKPSKTTIIALIGSRYNRGLRQKDVAKLIGVSPITLSRYENLQLAPSFETLALWRSAVGLRSAETLRAA